MSENENLNTEQTQNENKLYAGKFKTIEELEKGYNNAAPVFQENQALKRQIEELSKIPEDYNLPEGIELDQDDLVSIKEIAKKTKLRQENFDELAKETYLKKKTNIERIESIKKELGNEKINIITDYVKNNYPPELHETVIDKAINDSSTRNSILTHREKLIKNNVPGISNISLPSSIKYEDIISARKLVEKEPGNKQALNSYLNLLKQKSLHK